MDGHSPELRALVTDCAFALDKVSARRCGQAGSACPAGVTAAWPPLVYRALAPVSATRLSTCKGQRPPHTGPGLGVVTAGSRALSSVGSEHILAWEPLRQGGAAHRPPHHLPEMGNILKAKSRKQGRRRPSRTRAAPRGGPAAARGRHRGGAEGSVPPPRRPQAGLCRGGRPPRAGAPGIAAGPVTWCLQGDCSSAGHCIHCPLKFETSRGGRRG